jgi:integrase
MYQEALGERRTTDFFAEMDGFFDWMLTSGLSPNARNPTGYERSTAANNLQRLGRTLPQLWQQHGGYTLIVTNDLADWYVEQLEDDEITKDTGEPYADSTKRKHACALYAYKRWRTDQRGGDAWRPHTLFDHEPSQKPMADPIKLAERKQLREAVLEYETVTQYNNCTPEERDRIRALLAQRLGKPKSDVTKDDWEDVNRCWKYPSLFHVTLDTALRPVEVERAKVGWVNLAENRLEIPKDEAAKNDACWETPFRSRTGGSLKRWLKQRAADPAYDDTDALWLTREGNPFSSGPLGNRLRSLMEAAGIPIGGRDISWYSLRHSLATHMATITNNIEEIRLQLRHKCIESTLRYIHPPEENVRDHLAQL